MRLSQLYNELVLCGNSVFHNNMKETKKWFSQRQIPCYLSLEDPSLWEHYDIFSYDKYIACTYQKIVRKIRDPRTFGLVVFNYDFHGVKNYIEPSVFAQIAIAATQGKKIYLNCNFPELYEKELSFWNCKLIYGNIDIIYKDISKKIIMDKQQLSLFD